VKRYGLLGIVLFWLATENLASAELASLDGLADYQVFQRDDTNTASFTFRGETKFAGEGIVETRVQKEWLGDTIQDWKKAGTCNQGQFEATVL